MAQKFSSTLITVGGLLAGGSLFLNRFFYTVDAGERAIIFDKLQRRINPTVYNEGMHFYVPFYQTPIKYEVRLQPKTISSQTGTKDMQAVNIAVRMLYKPIHKFLPEIHKNSGKNYEEKILPSIGNEVLKAIVAKYDSDQLLKQRQEISTQIQEKLTLRAKDFHIALDDVSIIHLSFMKEYADAIEQKQVAQQMAERQKFIVLKDEEEKKADIIRAEGEAETAKLINDAVKKYGDALIKIRKLDTARYIAETLATSPNISYVPSSMGNLLNLNISR